MGAVAESVSREKETEARTPGNAGNQIAAPQPHPEVDPVLPRGRDGAPSQQALTVPALQRTQRLFGNRATQQIISRAGGPIQAKASDGSKTSPPPEPDDLVSSQGSSQSLDPETRNEMEAQFRTELRGVRLHTDPQAAASAEVLNADAYTVGRDIYFARGKYAPATDDGKRLLAHELAHTVQQADGQVPPKETQLQEKEPNAPTDDPLEKQADQAADAVAKPAVGNPKDKTALAPDAQAPASPLPLAATPPKPLDNKAPGKAVVPAAGPPAAVDLSPPKQKKAAVQPIKKKGGEVPGVAAAAGVAPARTPVPVLTPTGPGPLSAPADLTNPEPIAAGAAASLLAQKYDPSDATAQVEADLANFMAAAEKRKDDLRGAAERTKASVVEDSEAQKKAVHAQIAQSVGTVRGNIAAIRAKLHADATQAKASVAVITGAGFLKLTAETLAENKGIMDSAEVYKNKASEAVARLQDETRSFSAAEGARGKAAIDAQSQEAIKRGQTKAAGYPKDDRGDVQMRAVLLVASDTSEKLKKPGPDLESSIVDAGNELADGIGEPQQKVQEAIGQQAPQITEQLENKAAELGQQLDRIRTEVAKGIDDFLSETNQSLDEVERTVNAQLAALETTTVAQIGTSATDVGSMIDVETGSVIASIDGLEVSTAAATRKIKRPHPPGVALALGTAETTLDRTAAAFTTNLEAARQAAHSGFTQGGASITGGISDIEANIVGDLSKVETGAHAGIEAIAGKAKEGTDKLCEAWTGALKGARGEADKGWESAVTGMAKDTEKGLLPGKQKLTSQVDEAVQKNREPLDQLDTNMEAAAKEARDDYDAPWYEHALSWVWHGIVSFIKAVIILVVVVVLLVVAIALILADSIVAIVIGVILLVAVVGYLLYGAIKGWIARVESAENIWEAGWAGIVGVLDIVGIPGVIEGIIQHDIVNGRRLTAAEAGDRFGSGLLGVLLLFIPGPKGEVPVKPRIPVDVPPTLPDIPVPHDVPVDPAPVDPNAPAPKPLEPKPPESKPPDPTSCFVAGTLVLTGQGLRPIETLRPGDFLCSVDPVDNSVRSDRVRVTALRIANEVLDLVLGQTTATCSPEHPFWVPGDGWRNAGDLVPGVQLLSRSLGLITLDSVTRRPGPVEVFNIAVDGSHTFLVSEVEILVHNKAMARTPLIERIADLRKQAFDASEQANEIPREHPRKFEWMDRANKLRSDLERLNKDAESASPEELEEILEPEYADLETKALDLKEEMDEAAPEPAPVAGDPRPHLKYPNSKLPTGGEFPYNSGDPANEVVHSSNPPGALDANGNVWQVDPTKARTGRFFEWDVQHPDGTHTNVGEDGTITH